MTSEVHSRALEARIADLRRAAALDRLVAETRRERQLPHTEIAIQRRIRAISRALSGRSANQSIRVSNSHRSKTVDYASDSS
jgi:hypothetical protein